jgi:hypothetical protein
LRSARLARAHRHGGVRRRTCSPRVRDWRYRGGHANRLKVGRSGAVKRSSMISKQILCRWRHFGRKMGSLGRGGEKNYRLPMDRSKCAHGAQPVSAP